jgi:hypothetical protein
MILDREALVGRISSVLHGPEGGTLQNTARLIVDELGLFQEGWESRISFQKAVECKCGYTAVKFKALNEHQADYVICTKCGQGEEVPFGTALQVAIAEIELQRADRPPR